MKKVFFCLCFILIIIPKTCFALSISSRSAILMDMDSGRILYEKAKDTPRLIASITKIMTAIVAIESGKLNDVVVVDDSLLDSVDVTSGLKESGAIIINTTQDGNSLKSKLKDYKGEIYTIDARKVSIEALGKYFPNTPMLAAVVKVSKIMDEKIFLEDMEKSFAHKFAKKPEVIPGNMEALKRSLNEVKGL